MVQEEREAIEQELAGIEAEADEMRERMEKKREILRQKDLTCM